MAAAVAVIRWVGVRAVKAASARVPQPGGACPYQHGLVVRAAGAVVDQEAGLPVWGEEFDGAGLGRTVVSPAGVEERAGGLAPVQRTGGEEERCVLVGVVVGVVAGQGGGQAGDDLGGGGVVERRRPTGWGDGVVGGGDLPQFVVVAEPADADAVVGGGDEQLAGAVVEVVVRPVGDGGEAGVSGPVGSGGVAGCDEVLAPLLGGGVVRHGVSFAPVSGAGREGWAAQVGCAFACRRAVPGWTGASRGCG
jgi:hypothetical protein